MWEIKVYNHTKQQTKLQFRMVLRHYIHFKFKTSNLHLLRFVLHNKYNNIHYLLVFLHQIRRKPENQKTEEHILLTSYDFFSTCLALCTQLTPRTASVVPPEDRLLMPETYRGLRHNKVIVKVKVNKISKSKRLFPA
jgi:hypothetical protein